MKSVVSCIWEDQEAEKFPSTSLSMSQSQYAGIEWNLCQIWKCIEDITGEHGIVDYEEVSGLIKAMELVINKWHGEIFKCALVKGERLYEAFEALRVIEYRIMELYNLELSGRENWKKYEYSVGNFKGVTAYKGTIHRNQNKLWRDTALIAIVQHDQATINAVKKFHDESKVDSIISCLPKQCFKAGEKNGRDVGRDGQPIENEWYTDNAAMKTAVPLLRKLLQNSRKDSELDSKKIKM